ncbi:selenoprotein S isoform X1 [Monodelphis domestica]|uniref:selenoprotein S isoform X1 n=1 Tax=Monodelphis domestica TaxID=13616 RepID=UPI0024E1DDCA|nr:selenoprotein S isoform X1 [Monodelphis domestica]
MDLDEEEQQQLLAKPALELEGIRFLQETVGWLLSNYGWYLLFSFIILYVIFQKLFGKFRVMRQRALEASVASSIEPDTVVKQQEALAASRLRMQEELNTQAEKYKEKLKQEFRFYHSATGMEKQGENVEAEGKLEEEKRKQKIEMWESMQEGKSYKGKAKKWPQQEPEPGPSTSSNIPKPKPDRKSLRGSGYNPLTGEGSGTCSWRPGRRGPSSGG